MKIYSNLAVNGIKKNKKLYIPYILTAVLMIAIFYILSFLGTSSILDTLASHESVKMMMTLGGYIIAIFSAIFLFYTNSFLIKRRKKEFGLYNVLGMNKHSIAKILVWESLIVFGISVLLGLVTGIAFSKLAELCFVNMVKSAVSYRFEISLKSILLTIALFAAIYFLIFLNSIRQIRFSNPMALVRSENAGEKPPKANWVFGIAGILILAYAYYIAVTIKSPIVAILWFFGAVIMVIVATYLIFISGSVLMCRILQKKKSYYYKKEHFVSVSGMAYRMKRNGAGLASICILLTMVFVMISSTACLYFGCDETVKRRYPRDMTYAVYYECAELASDENIAPVRELINSKLNEYNAKTENIWDYRDLTVSGMLDKNGNVYLDSESASSRDYNNLVNIHFVPLDDLTKMNGKSYTLADGEAVAYITDFEKNPTCLTFGKTEIRITEMVDKVSLWSSFSGDTFPNVYLFVPDLQWVSDSIVDGMSDDPNFLAEYYAETRWYYGFNTGLDEKENNRLYDEIENAILELDPFGEGKAIGYMFSNSAYERADYFGGVSGFLFLAVMLSLVFLVAAVLIIYYKQISEGYEDRARFDIMQKVGMTKRDIKKSIKSQMLTVFFMPIIVAVSHLCFAFPMVRKLLLLFGLNNLKLFIMTAAISVVVFAVFYMIVYRVTSNSYYAIVSGAKEE